MFKQDDNRTLVHTEYGTELTGGQLSAFVEQLSNYCEPRSLVFCLCSNTLGSLTGYVGFLENRVVPVMLDAGMNEGLLYELVKTYNPRYIWLPAKDIGKELYAGRNMTFQAYNYCLLESADKIKHDLHPDLALLLTTSGSTGSPKLVRLTYRNIEANAKSIAEYLEITEHERPITSLPMHYSYGLSVINSHLLKGATILLTDKSIVSKDFWTFFTEQGATSFSGVPYTYQIMKQFRLLKKELPTLKTLTQAGGRLSPELVEEFARFAENTGRRFFVMYGQTEATARMSYLPFENVLTKTSSIGIAIPGGNFSLLDARGNEIVEPEMEGELLYAGDNVSMGYADGPEDLAKEDENRGVLRTGDIARRDADGFYYIVGRLKRFIKIFGNRVNLDQAEQIAKQLNADCACTGVDDKLTIYITDESLSAQMREYMSHKLGLHHSAIAVNVVTEIPKNSSGKTQYSKLS